MCLYSRTKHTELKILISNHIFYQYIYALLTLLVFFAPNVTAQNVVNVEGSGEKWVNIGDLDVSGNQITVEAVMRRQNNANIISKHDATTDCNYLFRPNSFQITTTNDFYICLNPYTLSTNTWYHVAATYDGSSIKYYVDGCLVNEVPATGDLVTNDWDVAIGSR